MDIIDNKALLIRTRSPSKYSVIPRSKVVEEHADGSSSVAVFWGLDEVRVLKNLGVKNVPSPITRKYNWPGRYTPMSHQIETSAFLTLNRKAFVFSEPGTGKTLSALWAADYLMQRGEVRRVLILCPLSIMQSAWMGDISNSVIHRSAIIAHHPQASRRIEMLQKDYELVITNYEGLNLIASEIVSNGKFDLVIVDEANAYKTMSTKRWKSLSTIIKPNTFLWMMTGTPASQSPVDAYGLARLVNPNGVPKFFTAWRDKVMNKITMFKWAAKPEAKHLVFDALQPAIRFTKAQCLDLPPVVTVTREVQLTPQQAKYYNLLKEKMMVYAAGETISAVNAAAVVSKLLQISCIAYNTPVLTGGGWVPIQQVRDTDLIWDGEEFVEHEGLVLKGLRETVECHGVRMTPEHEVLTCSGWKTAQEVLDGDARAGLDRQPVRLPDGVSPTRYFRWDDEEGDMAVRVRMRAEGGAGEPVPAHEAPNAPAQLWVRARQQNTRDVTDTGVQQLGEHAKALHGPVRQRLAQLRRAWHHSVQAMGDFFRGVLDGHGVLVPARADAGPRAQLGQLQQRQLSLGNVRRARQQQAHKRGAENTQGAYDIGTSGASVRTPLRYVERTADALQMAPTPRLDDAGKTAVFDIKNSGPRHRFVVMGCDGQLLVVHNCGAAYTDDHEVVEFDAGPRLRVLEEILEETDRKVLIFALFRSSIDAIHTHLLKQGISAECIHGSVPASKRGDIIKRFQTEAAPRVLVMQPQASAHGITLTAADTVVFYGPLMSVEQYVQCIARADRKGQDSDKVTVIHIEGSPIEKKMFKALQLNVSNHSLLTQMFDMEIKN